MFGCRLCADLGVLSTVMEESFEIELAVDIIGCFISSADLVCEIVEDHGMEAISWMDIKDPRNLATSIVKMAMRDSQARRGSLGLKCKDLVTSACA